jgi:hypothetical protein
MTIKLTAHLLVVSRDRGYAPSFTDVAYGGLRDPADADPLRSEHVHHIIAIRPRSRLVVICNVDKGATMAG